MQMPTPPDNPDANTDTEDTSPVPQINGILAHPIPTAEAESTVAAILGGEAEYYPDLPLSTKARIFGDTHQADIEPELSDEQRENVMLNGDCGCMYCGLQSLYNQVHNLNDNHQDIRPENLGVIDPICHASTHLGELPPDAATLAWLPGLSRQDVNHLQRTAMIALQSGNEQLAQAARQLFDWLQMHSIYVRSDLALKTSVPAELADALVRVKDEKIKAKAQDVVLQDVAVLLDPEKYALPEGMAQELLDEYPVDVEWPDAEEDPSDDDEPAANGWDLVLHGILTEAIKGEKTHGHHS